jgi:hypothetical protein
MSRLTAVAEVDHRQESRMDTALRAVIQIKNSEDEVYKEITSISTVSRNGAGFTLSQPCPVGRLLTIVLPMPRELRAYDEDTNLYPVMGIVQYCNEGMVGTTKVYHIGVGFIGKQIPDSFREDPTQNYRITGMNKAGLWEITESVSQFQNRKKPRHWISLPVTITLIHKEEGSTIREDTYTKNVGAGGVSVTSSLSAAVGDKVKFACETIDFYAIAVVRNVKSDDQGVSTLHLHFVDDEFPVDKVINTRPGL